MDFELKQIMLEIVDIIEEIGCCDINQNNISMTKRDELCCLFKDKLEQAKKIHHMSQFD